MNLYMLGNRQGVVHKPNKKTTTSQHNSPCRLICPWHACMLMGPIIQTPMGHQRNVEMTRFFLLFRPVLSSTWARILARQRLNEPKECAAQPNLHCAITGHILMGLWWAQQKLKSITIRTGHLCRRWCQFQWECHRHSYLDWNLKNYAIGVLWWWHTSHIS